LYEKDGFANQDNKVSFIIIKKQKNYLKIRHLDTNEKNIMEVFHKTELKQIALDIISDAGFQKQFKTNRQNFHIFDGAEHFFNEKKMSEVCSINYSPTDKDILMCRRKSVGISMSEVLENGIKYSFLDVGGQRSERKKWPSRNFFFSKQTIKKKKIKKLVFADLNSLIFLCAISEYDQVLYEDDKTNRMEESLNLFEQHINNEHFKEKQIYLVLNKIDLFKKKIKNAPLNKFFKDFEGGDNFESAIDVKKKI
jgi:guanine nucleotide-binding protein G(i) subunit alpha